jgi:hypothetical protein
MKATQQKLNSKDFLMEAKELKIPLSNGEFLVVLDGDQI